MSEFEKKKMKLPKATRPKKYQHILDMEVRDSKTLEGETVIYPNTELNYMRLCSGVIPRYNKQFAPKHWVFAISEDKKNILIQRDS
jgi:hypothetical protein